MWKKLAISVFLVALGAASTQVWAAPSQSLHFNVPAPAGSAAGADDLRIASKADGVPSIGSGSIDLIAGDAAELVTRKAAKAFCLSAFAKPGANCARDLPATVCAGAACCDSFDTPVTTIFHCANSAGNGFELSRTVGLPTEIGIGAVPFGVGNITHLTADTRGVYTDLGVDIASRSLIQIRPEGITGTITLRITHTQGGTNPRLATVTVDSTNNDPGESLALHTAIENALENISPALPVPIVATTHPLMDATSPLTAFGFLKQATSFTEITNIGAAGITKVDVVIPAGHGLTIEGTENVIDANGGAAQVPALNDWGIVVLVMVLLLCGYWLMRRQGTGTATT